MPAPTEPWEVYAVKYARNDRPRRPDVFLGGDTSTDPMPLDYFVWVLRRAGRTVLLDLGFHHDVAARRGRTLLRTPTEALAAFGITPNDVDEIYISHLHFDHAGRIDLFPDVPLHIQRSEMVFATGACMPTHAVGSFYEEDDVVELVRRVFRGQVIFHDGDDVVEEGLSVHLIGGHTDGSQVLRVWTRRGWLVLASDASHFYANVFEKRPFMWTYNVGDNILGFDRLLALADSPDHVIPGHDPLVMEQYPAPSDELEGIVARLDVSPRFSIAERFVG